MLTVEVRIVGQVAILDCAGRLTIGGDGVVKFRNALRNVLSMYYKRILLNFKDVQYIDNSGIGELVSTLTAVNNARGKLKLACLPRRVRDLLKITRLYSVFDVSETEEEALEKFRK